MRSEVKKKGGVACGVEYSDGPDWARLGDSFDEVIGFITTLAFPGCADGSVSSSDHRTTKYEQQLIHESIVFKNTFRKTLQTAENRLT